MDNFRNHGARIGLYRILSGAADFTCVKG
jgi:hypothetical protein